MRKYIDDSPEIAQHSITDFLFDEEASIPKSKLITIGSLMVILAFVLSTQDALAAHRSHSSHSSHKSHSSGASHRSHHESHSSHSSHASHGSSTPRGNAGSSQGGSAGENSGHVSRATITPTPRPTPTPLPSPVPQNKIDIPLLLPDTIPFK